MSNHPLQQLAHLKSKVATLATETEQIKALVNQPSDTKELAAAFDAGMSEMRQQVGEDFEQMQKEIVKSFAAFFEPLVERTTNRMAQLEARAEKAGERQSELEQRLERHLEEVGAKLDGFNRGIDERFVNFSNNLVGHHQSNDATLRLLAQYVQRCERLAAATVEASRSCLSFKRDYEETVKQAKRVTGETARRVEEEISTFTRTIRKRTDEVMEPLFSRMKSLTSSQLERREKWAVAGIVLGIIIFVSVSWMASPPASMVRDAAR
jgi:dihydroxyacetone kinase DhaKLM complex PTS-EIIA-like component DhaM